MPPSRLGEHVGEEFAEFSTQVFADDDVIDEAVLQHKLRSLEARWQVLVGGFLDHPWASEADHALGLGEVDVANGGKGCGNAARGRMGEY